MLALSQTSAFTTYSKPSISNSAMEKLTSFSLIVVAIIHLLPLAGVMSADKLSLLYGVTLDDPNLVILMRHRAVIFALLGGFILLSAFQPQLQLIAIIAAYISVLAFLIIAWQTGDYSAAIRKVVILDVLALLCLLLASIKFVAPLVTRS